MAYSIHADLLAEQKKTAYAPSLLLTVEDNGLLHPSTRLATTTDTGEGTMVYTGAEFVRAYARNGAGIYVQRITNPATASQWTTWTLLVSGSQYVNPVLLSVPGYVVLVYADSSTSPNTVIYWRRSADGGQTWNAAQTLLTSTYTLETALCGISCTNLYGANYGGIYFKGDAAGTLLARRFYDPATDTWSGAGYTADVSGLGLLRELSGVLTEGVSARVQLAALFGDAATGLSSVVYLMLVDHHPGAVHDLSYTSRKLRALPPLLTAYYTGLAFTRRDNTAAWLAVHLWRDPALSRLERVTIVAKAENEFSDQFDGGLFMDSTYGRLFVYRWAATGITYAADLQGVWVSQAVATLAADTTRIISYKLDAAGPNLGLDVTLDNRDGALSGLLAGYLGADVVFERGAVCGGTARRVAVGRMVLAEVTGVGDDSQIEVKAYGYWQLISLWRGDVGYSFGAYELWQLIETVLGLAGVRGFAYEGWDTTLAEPSEDPFIYVVDQFKVGAGQSVAEAIRSLQEQYQFVVRPAGDKAFMGYAFGFIQSSEANEAVEAFEDDYHPYWPVSAAETRAVPRSTWFMVAGEGVVADAGAAVRYETGRQYTRLISKRYTASLSEVSALALSATGKAEEEVESGRFECLPAFQVQPFDHVVYRGLDRLVGRVTEWLGLEGWRQRIELSDFGVEVAGGSSTGEDPTLGRGSKVIRGEVVSFDAVSYVAQIRLESSISDAVPIPCGQYLPAALLTAGASVAVLLFDESNPSDGLVVGPYGAASPTVKDDAFLLARANHTGTQAPATLSPQGAGSGLNADQVDGSHASAFATSGHTHAAVDVGARVYNSGVLTIANNAWTALTFNSERYDNGGCHSTVSNTGRLTAPQAGRYLITGHANFAGNATGQRGLRIQHQGGTTIAVVLQDATSAFGNQFSVATIYSLAAGEYVTLEVFQNSGGNLDVQVTGNNSPEFGMQLLGA